LSTSYTFIDLPDKPQKERYTMPQINIEFGPFKTCVECQETPTEVNGKKVGAWFHFDSVSYDFVPGTFQKCNIEEHGGIVGIGGIEDLRPNATGVIDYECCAVIDVVAILGMPNGNPRLFSDSYLNALRLSYLKETYVLHKDLVVADFQALTREGCKYLVTCGRMNYPASAINEIMVQQLSKLRQYLRKEIAQNNGATLDDLEKQLLFLQS